MKKGARVYLIAEAGVNHNGDERLAMELIGTAARAGADAVKFQTFRAELLVQPDAPTAAYQQANTGERSQFAMLRQLQLPDEAYARLAARCREVGIEFLSTPFDEQAADQLIALGMRRLKVGSGEVTNLPFLRHLARLRRPIILSTGMATLAEVGEAVEAIRATDEETRWEVALAERLTLLHCTSNYPTAAEDVNLRAMLTLQAEFRVPVGYSDHTEGILAATAAVAMGATVIEKHFTLDRMLPGPDHRASLEPDELAELVRQVRQVECMQGTGIKQPTESEIGVRNLVRRSIVARRAIARGARIEEADLQLLRPGTGIAPKDLQRVIGRRAKIALLAGEVLAWSHLDE